MTPSTKAQGKSYDGPERRENRDSEAYFNAQFGLKPLHIGPGEYANSADSSEMVVANIGTGVAVTFHDRALKLGGMAYLYIPDQAVEAFPYFNKLPDDLMYKILLPVEDCLIDLKQHGTSKNRVRIRLIGGAVFKDDKQDRGTKTYILLKEFLSRYGLNILSENIAGPYIRRVHFLPYNGRTVRRILRRKEDFDAIIRAEAAYGERFK